MRHNTEKSHNLVRLGAYARFIPHGPWFLRVCLFACIFPLRGWTWHQKYPLSVPGSPIGAHKGLKHTWHGVWSTESSQGLSYMYLSGSQRTKQNSWQIWAIEVASVHPTSASTSNNAMHHLRETSANILLHINMMHAYALGIWIL